MGVQTLIKEGYSAFGSHTLATAAPKVFKGAKYPLMNAKQAAASSARAEASQLGDIIPGRKLADEVFNPETIPKLGQKQPILNSESFNESYSGVKSSVTPTTNSNHMFAEIGSNFRKTMAATGNAIFEGGYAGGLKTSLAATVGGAVAGGGFFGVMNAADPNNFEYQGMTSPIIKGAMMGATLGLMHKGSGAMMKTYGHAPNSAQYNFAKKVQSVSSHPLTKGALGVAAFAGVGETHLTKPINDQRPY